MPQNSRPSYRSAPSHPVHLPVPEIVQLGTPHGQAIRHLHLQDVGRVPAAPHLAVGYLSAQPPTERTGLRSCERALPPAESRMA